MANFANNYMGYPQYGNYGYQTQYQRPIMQQEQEQSIAPFRRVMFLNAKEVAGRIIDPNTTELFIDRDSKIAYVKSADQMGFSSTKAYRLEELTEDEQNGLSSPKFEPNMEDYVKKETFDSFTKRLSDKLGQIESKISAKELKGD